VVFLEETGEKPYRVHRMILQMLQSGCFNGVKGIALGYFSNCVHARGEGASWEEVVAELTKELGVSAVSGVNSGHEGLNLAVRF
jgi:muramoyltetrapeptide carboxypeptidase